MSNLESNSVVSNDLKKEEIRCMISTVYDLQKMRISAGNRLVQSFYISLGVKPSTSPDDAGELEVKFIDTLKKEFKLISDAVVANRELLGKEIRPETAIKRILAGDEKLIDAITAKQTRGSKQKPTDTSLTGDISEIELIKYITNDNLYGLVSSYMKLLESEEGLVKVLDKTVKEHPLWDAFFKDIKGCGTLMSAVCIAYLDPFKAKYPSSFFRYCGLDTVQDEDKFGNPLFLKKVNGQVLGQKVRIKYGYYNEAGEQVFEDVKPLSEYDADGNQLFVSESGETVLKFPIERVIEGETYTVYEDIDTNEEYVGDTVISQHGRRMGDTEMFEYTDKDGNIALKRGITYNPVVKTKLMGVLTGCLIKAKDPTYSKIYYDYKSRLENSEKHKNSTPAHRNMMAQRYMIKQFLRNLHTEWRHLEGLPIYEPYEVEKLGHKPHHLNEQQYQLAQEYKASH